MSRRERRARGRSSCSSIWAWRTGQATCPKRSPAASSSAWPWPAPGQPAQPDSGGRADRGPRQPSRAAGDGALSQGGPRAGLGGDRRHPRPPRPRCLRPNLRDGGRPAQIGAVLLGVMDQNNRRVELAVPASRSGAGPKPCCPQSAGETGGIALFVLGVPNRRRDRYCITFVYSFRLAWSGLRVSSF